MKITAIKSYPAWSVWRNVYLVKIETDERYLGVRGRQTVNTGGEFPQERSAPQSGGISPTRQRLPPRPVLL